MSWQCIPSDLTKPSVITVMKERFEDTKWIIRSIKSKKSRQYNDKQKKEERTTNDLNNTTQKTKGRITRTQLQTGDESICSGD